MVLQIHSATHAKLEERYTIVAERIERIETKLSFLYPQVEVGIKMSMHVRGPAPHAMRQIEAINRKISALEPQLRDARAELRSIQGRLAS